MVHSILPAKVSAVIGTGTADGMMLEPIKTLHITNAWQENSGGIATFYRALMRAANDQEREVRLIVPAEVDAVEQAGRHVRIYHLAAPQAPLNSHYRVLYPREFLFAGSKMQAILARERPDVVEVCDKYNLNYLGALLRLGLLRGVGYRPLVLGLTCERMDENFATYIHAGRLSRWFCSWYMRWLYFPFFDHHVAVSKHTARELAVAAQGHAVKRGVWIRPMGVDVTGLSPARRSSDKRRELLQKIGVQKDTALLLYVGRLVPEKNLSLLLETVKCFAATNGDCRLLLVGDGIERRRLERKTENMIPGRAAFLGHIRDRQELADIYANCDVFIHPNPREPFGIAPLEAMASGLPLVAPERGGVISFANPANAWLRPPDGKEFAEAIHEILSSESEHERLRSSRIAAGLATAQQYCWDRITLSFFELYDALFAAFREQRSVDECAPDFCSSAPSFVSRTAASASASIAKAAFAGISRWMLQHQEVTRAQSPKRDLPHEIPVDSAENSLDIIGMNQERRTG